MSARGSVADGFTEAAHHQPPGAGSAHLALPAAAWPEKWVLLTVWLGGTSWRWGAKWGRGEGGAKGEGWGKERGAGAVVGRRD